MHTNLAPWQMRAMEELKQLAERVELLGKFLETAAFLELNRGEQSRLRSQYGYMCGYKAVLADRIAHFLEI